MFHLCFSFTDSSGEYYKHALVSLLSVLMHTQSQLCIHILSDSTFTKDKKECFEKLCANYNQEICFYSLEEIPEQVYRNIPPNFGKGSLFRLFIPELINGDKVLYLDCDIVCQIDVNDIFSIDIGDAYLGAVLDNAIEDQELSNGYIKKLGLEPTHYINSGVLVFNNVKLKQKYPDFKDAVLTMVAQQKFRFPDQDALNLLFPVRTGNVSPTTSIEHVKVNSKHQAPVFGNTNGYPKGNNPMNSHKGAVFILPEHFNYTTWPMERGYYPLSHYKNKLVHFTCKKPWTTLYPASLLYWKYYCQLFSITDAFQHIEKLELNKYTPLFHKLLQDDKSRRWFNRIHEVSTQGLFATILDRILPARRKKKKSHILHKS